MGQNIEEPPMDLISIIIPIYNVEKYLSKCIDSVLNQSYAHCEIILVDDGSTDRSGEIADQYESLFPEKITVVHQENGGLGSARNTGLKRATGKYVLFLDSDDWLERSTIEELYAEALKHGCDLSICNIVNVAEDDSIINENHENLPPNVELTLKDRPDMLFSNPSACNKLFMRSLFLENNIFFPSGLWFEDICTISKLYLLDVKAVYIDRPLYYYLSREESITKNKNISRNLDILASFNEILDFYSRRGMRDLYFHELEFLAIQHVFIASSVRVLRADSRSRIVNKFYQYMILNFKNFRNNPYLSRLSVNQRIIYQLLLRRKYSLIRLIFQLKDFVCTAKRRLRAFLRIKAGRTSRAG
jgi:glycosyltransferase involved in cell wall biosynthesis